MSDFINLNKRSVDLPEGCKNLADVLAWKSSPLRQKLIRDKLGHVGKYIAWAWESAASGLLLCFTPCAELMIQPPCFSIQRSGGGELRANVQVRLRTKTEVALLWFLRRNGYSVPDNSIPKQFSPHLPVELMCRISPLPGEAMGGLGFKALS